MLYMIFQYDWERTGSNPADINLISFEGLLVKNIIRMFKSIDTEQKLCHYVGYNLRWFIYTQYPRAV